MVFSMQINKYCSIYSEKYINYLANGEVIFNDVRNYNDPFEFHSLMETNDFSEYYSVVNFQRHTMW